MRLQMRLLPFLLLFSVKRCMIIVFKSAENGVEK